MELHFFFFLSSRGRNVSWERLLSLDPLEIAGTIKKKRRGRVTGIEIYEISTHSLKKRREAIHRFRERSVVKWREKRYDSSVKRKNILSLSISCNVRMDLDRTNDIISIMELGRAIYEMLLHSNSCCISQLFHTFTIISRQSSLILN